MTHDNHTNSDYIYKHKYTEKKMTLKNFYSPMVGIVVTISPSFSLYKIVVLPAASNPTINILISFLPKRPLNKFENILPIVLAIC